VITKVEAGGEAESLRLGPGDLVAGAVSEGKRRAITSAEDFDKEVTEKSLQDGLQLIVRSKQGFTRYLFLKYD
jgi:hypothetical protein